MQLLLRKHFTPLVLAAIIVLGAFLRLYNFSPWLHFELDQARDTIFVSEAVTKGPLELPLLGPKASGTALRVGPAYYYLEYLSALVFGNTPAGHAFFIPLLSIISIYFFFLLLKRFFNNFIALGLSYVYAISLFFVLFSRFSWNPNLLPFVIIVGIYSLLRATDQSSTHPARWFLFSILLFTIGTQLHFVAFFALPALLIIFLLHKKPRFSKKTWLASAFIVFVLYFPMIVNEIKFKGENTRAFFDALSKKSNAKHNIVEKIIQNTLSESEGYALMLSGDDHIVTPKLNLRKEKVSISCADYCKKTPTAKSLAAVLFFLSGFFLLIKKALKQKGELTALAAWLILTFLVFTALAYELPARFYLLSAPLPFFFLGLIVEFVWSKNRKIAKVLFLAIIVLLTYSNFSFLLQRFSELQKAPTEVIRIPSDNIVEEPTRVTLSQQQAIAQFLHDKYLQNGFPINIVYAEPFYRRSIKYLADRLGTPITLMDNQVVYSNANAVIILRTTNKGEKIFAEQLEKYDLANKKEFGTLSVYSLERKQEKITTPSPEIIHPFGGDTGDILRITWKDVLR